MRKLTLICFLGICLFYLMPIQVKASLFIPKRGSVNFELAERADSQNEIYVGIPIHLFINVGDTISIIPTMDIEDSSTTFSCELISGSVGAIEIASINGGKQFDFTAIKESLVGDCIFQITSSGGIIETFRITVIPEDSISTSIQINGNNGIWDNSTSTPQTFVFFEYNAGNGSRKNFLDLSEFSAKISKEGHVLVGWNTECDGSGNYFAPEDSLVYDDVTFSMLYAQWIPVSSESYVLFNTCLGSFDEENSGVAHNEFKVDGGDVVTAPRVFRDGYTLVGWLDSNDINNSGSGSLSNLENFYLPGEKITTTQNLNLFAQWIENSSGNQVLIYDTNAENVLFDDYKGIREIDISNNIVFCSNHSGLEREGFIFAGWNTDPFSAKDHFDIYDEINVAEAFPNDKVIILYAEWERIDLPENYFVFVAKDKIFANGKSYLIIDRDKPFELPILEDEEDAPFIGWKNDGVGSWGPANTCILLPNENISFNENAYLYPVYSISYYGGYSGCWLFVDANGGYIDSSSDIYLDFDMPMTWQAYDDINYYNKYANMHLELYSRDIYRNGYTLIGFNTKSDGSGTQYALGEFVPSAGLKTVLYAQWEKNDYNVDIEDSWIKITLESVIPTDASVFLTTYGDTGKMLTTLQGSVISNYCIVFPKNNLMHGGNCKLFLTDSRFTPIQNARSIVLK